MRRLATAVIIILAAHCGHVSVLGAETSTTAPTTQSIPSDAGVIEKILIIMPTDWRMDIEREGRVRYGFGSSANDFVTLPEKVFDFDEVSENLLQDLKAFGTKTKTQPITVVCVRRDGAPGTSMVSENWDLTIELLEKAYAAKSTPRVRELWSEHPPRPATHPSK